ncbi:hypothetical protein [Bacillus cereus]|uniref:hypothetical protein n=1 Tax=Bacillus cereus TaxID=1396 RepID=UPI0015D491FD|nr:hypothetical protein [Bacillus cereus]
MEEKYEVRVLKKRVEIATKTLKCMSEQETNSCKKLDLDYVITVLTNKSHGKMPF